MKRKLLIETPVCPRERLVIISYTTGFSFAEERIGPLAAIITTVFYLLALYLFALPNTHDNPFASIYSESLIKTTYQHLLLLVGFDTLIYRKYYDTPPILVGHQDYFLAPLPGSVALFVVYRPPSNSPDPTLSSHESKAPKHGHCRGKTSSPCLRPFTMHSFLAHFHGSN
jgi:hypothetical protein